MKAIPLKKQIDEDGRTVMVICEPAEADHVQITLPERKGFWGSNIIPVQTKGTRAGTGNWTWNGSTDKPTLKPSLLCYDPTPNGKRCHTWITEGRVQFLNDCTHELKGLTVDLEDVTF